jgi:hypothetical protein
MAPSIADTKKKRGRGRPPTGIGRNVGLRLYPDLEEKIDAWMAQQHEELSKPEALRRLIELGLAASASAGARNDA